MRQSLKSAEIGSISLTFGTRPGFAVQPPSAQYDDDGGRRRYQSGPLEPTPRT